MRMRRLNRTTSVPPTINRMISVEKAIREPAPRRVRLVGEHRREVVQLQPQEQRAKAQRRQQQADQRRARSPVLHRQRRHAEGEAAGEQHQRLREGAAELELRRRPGHARGRDELGAVDREQQREQHRVAYQEDPEPGKRSSKLSAILCALDEHQKLRRVTSKRASASVCCPSAQVDFGPARRLI